MTKIQRLELAMILDGRCDHPITTIGDKVVCCPPRTTTTTELPSTTTSTVATTTTLPNSTSTTPTTNAISTATSVAREPVVTQPVSGNRTVGSTGPHPTLPPTGGGGSVAGYGGAMMVAGIALALIGRKWHHNG